MLIGAHRQLAPMSIAVLSSARGNRFYSSSYEDQTADEFRRPTVRSYWVAARPFTVTRMIRLVLLWWIEQVDDAGVNVAGRDRPALEGFRRRVEAHERVRRLPDSLYQTMPSTTASA